MNTRLVPSLQSILYRLVGAASEEVLRRPESDPAPGRFPVVVRPQTRAFLETQAKFLGGSMATIAGAILDGVALATLQRDGGATAMRGIVDRFNLLLQEHELSIPAASAALEELGFTLSDFGSYEAQQVKLTSQCLEAVAAKFFVNYDWLSAKSDAPTQHEYSWYKQPDAAAEKLARAARSCREVELILLMPDSADLSSKDEDDPRQAPHFVPILKRRTDAGPREVLETFEVWEEGRWSYDPCREHIKLVVFFATQLAKRRSSVHVSGRTTSAAQYDALINGSVLAATVLKSSTRVTWHPDDYVMPDSRVAKDVRDWARIRNHDAYARVFDRFDELMSKG